MSWQYSDAPSHIAPEVGPNILAGNGPWSGVVLDPGAVHVLSVEVNAPGETTVGWGVTATDGSGGEYVLADASDGETVPGGQWVTVTRNLPAPAFPATATVTLTVPDGTQTRNPAMGVRTGRTILAVPGDVLAENIMAAGGIVAGTPGGARVELTDEGLVAFDASGTETARIQGNGGEFVGGSFRTSDTLPGQVRLSDTAADGGPGLQVTPSGAGSYETLPWIGPRNGGIRVDGGEDGAGNGSFTFVSPRMVNLQTSRDGEEAGSVYVSENLVSLSRRAALGERGEVAAFPGFVRVRYEHGGVERGLAIDQSGVWVHTNRDGATKYYNLEETAQDSGWNNFSINSGLELTDQTGWRNKGGIIWLSGAMRYDWPVGAWTNIATMPADIRPARAIRVPAPVDGRPTHLLEITASGIIRAYRPPNDAGGRWNLQISALMWPVG